MKVGNRAIGVPVERHNAVNKVPDFFIISMEDVGSILVNVDVFHIFAIDIATQMWTLVYHKARLSSLCRFVGKCSAK